jgi:4-aminobutyrate aminotransferase-like enzyme/Ser/Thr protein kinase RdoA (MazF antagonist)
MMGVAAVLRRDYGLEVAAIEPLGGSGRNYCVREADGRTFTLKIAGPAEPAERADFEAAAAAHASSVATLGVALPRTVRTLGGGLQSVVRDADADTGADVGADADTGADVGADADAGADVRVRLFEQVPGTAWLEADPAGPAQRHELGGVLGRLDRALADFDHPLAGRTHAWDLARAGQHRGKVPLVDDPARRRILDRAFHLHASAAPALAALPHSVIHGDANDENVLVEAGRITGLVDFGDSLRNPTVCELAIALAYAMLEQPAPLDAGAGVVRGYHAERPLSAGELEVLFPLVCGRLAVTVSIAAARRRTHPDHPTWFITEDRAWRLLEALDGVAPADAGRRLAAGTGLDPFTDTGSPVEVLRERRRARISGTLSTAYREPIKMVRGRGQFLIDAGGRPYLDLVNNVCHVGHCHPRVVEAGQRQMARLNTNTRYLYDGLTEYADRLCATLPAPLEVCFFVNSGSEANELALRLARARTGRRDVLVVEGAYHGHTGGLVEISPYKFMGRGGAGRPGPGVHVVPMPDGYRGAHRGRDRAAGEAYGDEVRAVVERAGAPIAAFITEPLLSCGGQVVPPPGWLETAFAHVRAAGGVCIADEVQTGFGRVGTHSWAFEAQGVVPDVFVLGKPMGNGHPMGAVITTREIADSFETGMEFFSTFGGNPVSCAIGLAVLDVIHDEGLQRNAFEVGAHFRDGLTALMHEHPLIGDVRGLGLFLGVELVRDRQTREPATSEAAELVNRLRHRGILASTDGPDANVIKIKPPMVIDKDDVDMALRVIGQELRDIGV